MNQDLKKTLWAAGTDKKLTDEQKEHALRQIISRAVVSEEVIGIFSAAGLKRPDIGVLSDEFLEDVHHMKERNRAVETAQVIDALIEMAKKFQAAARCGERLGLSSDEMAFYDALAMKEAAVRDLDDETLKKIASELVKAVRESATIDWNLKEGVRATMRAKVKRLLTQYDYPPDKEEKAIDLVLEQAELFATEEAA